MRTLFLLLATLLSVNAADLTPKQVSALQIPGQRSRGQCLRYAWSLNYVLFAKGMESKLLAYWHTPGLRGHAVVVFKSGGQWYLIENEKDRARPIKGKTDLERCQEFDSRAFGLYEDGFGWTGEDAAKWLIPLKKFFK